MYASEAIKTLGRLLGFRVTKYTHVKHGQSYFGLHCPAKPSTFLVQKPPANRDGGTETYWRKIPGYQGGFLLDGGVHFTAALRLVLGEEDPVVGVSAQTTQLQEYLPPVDTADAVMKTKSGVIGTLSMSFGTNFSGSDVSMACEKGSVNFSNQKFTVRYTHVRSEYVTEETKDFADEGSGVKEEVEAWANAILQRTPDP